MRALHRLPPLLRVLRVLWVLGFLTFLGVTSWAWWLGQASGRSQGQLYIVAWALLELGFACHWPVAAYNNTRPNPFRHPRRAAPWLESWLESWQGQLMGALALAVLPMASIILALFASQSLILFTVAGVVMVLGMAAYAAAEGWLVWVIK